MRSRFLTYLPPMPVKIMIWWLFPFSLFLSGSNSLPFNKTGNLNGETTKGVYIKYAQKSIFDKAVYQNNYCEFSEEELSDEDKSPFILSSVSDQNWTTDKQLAFNISCRCFHISTIPLYILLRSWKTHLC